MTYGYENLKLEKGMYAQSGKSFSRVLESLDPSENYCGTALEGLDAFQRQLKRFDIHVKGAGSDMVEKFFHTTDSAVLFPEFVSRVVRQGMESDILPEITATTTNFDGMDYRTIASVPTDDDKALRRVEEGAVLPTTAIRTQENLVKLHKRGRMLVASYEAIRFQRLDLFSVTLRQIGAYIARMHLDDAVQVLMNGDGNNNAADAYEIGSGSGKISGTAGTLTYSALLEFWSKFDPYSMNTMLVSNDVMLQMLKLSEFQNPLTGLNFQGTGTLSTPLGAKLLRTSAVPAGKLIGLDKNYALEHICGSEVMVEYDKLIDRQIERAAITSISGFAKPYLWLRQGASAAEPEESEGRADAEDRSRSVRRTAEKTTSARTAAGDAGARGSGERSASAAAPESGAGRHDAAETFVSAEGGDALRTARSVSGEIERDARRYDGGFYLY